MRTYSKVFAYLCVWYGIDDVQTTKWKHKNNKNTCVTVSSTRSPAVVVNMVFLSMNSNTVPHLIVGVCWRSSAHSHVFIHSATLVSLFWRDLLFLVCRYLALTTSNSALFCKRLMSAALQKEMDSSWQKITCSCCVNMVYAWVLLRGHVDACLYSYHVSIISSGWREIQPCRSKWIIAIQSCPYTVVVADEHKAFFVVLWTFHLVIE